MPHDTDPRPEPVSIIGLGPMGQAMTRALLAAGHQVTVWNRTVSRAEDLVADGAVLATSTADAVAASGLVILSLTDYQAMYDVLGDATDALDDRVIVNLSSDTPDRSREAATWAEKHGAGFITGGVMAPAPMVGTPAAYVYYSGPAHLLERHRDTLAVIGAIRELGDDPGLAQLMYQAQLDVFLTTLSSLMHATALLGTAGVPAARAMPELLTTVSDTPAMLEAGEDAGVGLGADIDTGKHPGHLSTATMMGATAQHIVATRKTLGVDTARPAAVLAHYRRAIDAGNGGDNWTRIIDGIRSPQ